VLSQAEAPEPGKESKIRYMAFIKCAECSREVSDQAATCPGCGAPIRTTIVPDVVTRARVTRAGGAWQAIGFVLILLGIVVGVALNPALGIVVGLGGFVFFIIGRSK
jgi:hypothetical protein